MIDEYRHLLLVKHASRGQMVAEQRKLVAFIGANLMCAGRKWASDETEAEALREAAAAMIEAEMNAHAAGKAALQAYRDLTRDNFHSFLTEGRSPGEAMKAVAAAWKTAAANPKNGGAPPAATRSAAWKAKAAEAVANAAGGEGADVTMEDDAAAAACAGGEGARGEGARGAVAAATTATLSRLQADRPEWIGAARAARWGVRGASSCAMRFACCRCKVETSTPGRSPNCAACPGSSTWRRIVAIALSCEKSLTMWQQKGSSVRSHFGDAQRSKLRTCPHASAHLECMFLTIVVPSQ
mmetsp:Transcript_35050/g.96811  ORF Transcript_35050/g.96811 Transcript_35050/m.96811 type:complete len:297 (+) Transcript_35050:700-1590(+)